MIAAHSSLMNGCLAVLSTSQGEEQDVYIRVDKKETLMWVAVNSCCLAVSATVDLRQRGDVTVSWK